MPFFQFGSQAIHYEITRSDRRKTVTISINQHGVKVVAPSNTEDQAIQQILHHKGIWIRTQLLHFEEMQQHSLQRKFVSGEKLPYLGRQYRLKVCKTTGTQEPKLSFYQGQFRARLPQDIAEHQHRDIIMPLYIDWVKHRGSALAKERINRFTIKFSHQPKAIVVKDQDQRWGSCTPAGTILLNWRIFLAPASIVDYVLVHELVHLQHMNHSKDYWDTVRMLLSDYEEKKEWLRLYGNTLYI
ncbi:M48 family metallopeptidase [Brevibacillus porteri]|uniref:M48 family peptidase n=1 Tax=Brevibacillus porteri TaxID=2126350 RepID=A0ABX5FU19_9BACL|nr:SprT family zinc-dependent metalloprotease [Brevibacillus porteri]MED1797379.1 SprT family zinc-dependent metalloprotease [Brevibacillus porteri]MED2129449.1 SprT family zinc-dependent metalloprotease [Brevibacillus porteri]MED2747628.1 SprT family zinc-dependent metalloprotease [Brevibacillus porteri]MED2815643.1 SprT family zinc-dependent metalloprotease [Brevibacillus porteri]MED2896756.1 SprT family zinc-dependent metalloprotease [Brevibacillus porteri]